jgi:WD40 repeat protein
MHHLGWQKLSVVLLGLVAAVSGLLLADRPAGAGGDPAIAVKLTQRFEVKDHRGRLAPDGKTLIVERWDSTGKIRVLDAQTGKELAALEKEPRLFELSPDGKVLTTLLTEFRSPDKPPKGQKEFKGEARYYEEMIVWDLANTRAPKLRLVIPDATRPVFSVDGRWLLVSRQEPKQPRRWELWGLDQGKRLADFPCKEGEYWPAFSPDGSVLALPDAEAVRLYDVPNGKERKVIDHKCGRPLYEINCVLFARGNANTRTVFAPDGKTLATGGDDGKVRLWDVATGKLAGTLSGHSQPHTYVRYSPDGKQLLTGSIGTAEVIRIAPGLPGKGPPVTSKAIIIDRAAGEVILWDVATLTRQRTLPIACPVSLAWSADGKILAAGDQSQVASGKPTALQLWDTTGGGRLGSWPGFDGAQFADDGRTLLTYDPGRVVVWDIAILRAR